MATLTKRQKQIFDFVDGYIRQHGFAPTYEETKKRFKLSALSTVAQHIDAIVSKGLLDRNENVSRGLELPKRDRMVSIPLLGTIAAGEPITLFEVPKETIAVSKNKVPTSGDVYALRVQGNSMIDENISDGDIILVKQQATAENGQKIVALIDNQEATLKKYFKERGHIRLQPANKNMEPIILQNGRDFTIQGVVIDIIQDAGFTQSTDIKPPSTQINSIRDKKISTYYEQPRFKLYQANCLDILAELPENSVDMVFADPPYNLSNGGFSVHAGRMVSVNKGDWDKSKGFNDDYDFHYKWLKACKRVLKLNGTLWVSGTYHSIYQCGHALQSLGYHILNDIAWFKPNASPNLSCRFFTASHETLLWARKEKKAKHIFNYNLMKNGNWPEDQLKKPGLQMRSVWSMGTPKPNEKKFGKHPTQKPLDLLKRIILASTNKGDIVLDPFTGSSTTGVAAHIQGRKFIGIDTDSKYLDLSIKRFEDLNHNLTSK